MHVRRMLNERIVTVRWTPAKKKRGTTKRSIEHKEEHMEKHAKDSVAGYDCDLLSQPGREG